MGYGSEGIMLGAEVRALFYLFKARRSRNVCALFRRLEASPDWRDCGCGWEAMDTVIRLDGWTKSRRCVLVRRPAEEKPEARPAKRPRGRPRKNAPVPVQQEFEFVECAKGRRIWDCYALVTNDTSLDFSTLRKSPNFGIMDTLGRFEVRERSAAGVQTMWFEPWRPR